MLKKISFEILTLLSIALLMIVIRQAFPVESVEMPEFRPQASSQLQEKVDKDSREKAESKKNRAEKTKVEKITENKININKADVSALITIHGIGEKTAEKIIAYRNEHGPFSSIEEIMQVKGIGEKKFAKIKRQITIMSQQDLDSLTK